MNQDGEGQTNTIFPSFNRSIRNDFRGAKISTDTGILLLREIDQRFNITSLLADRIEDSRRAKILFGGTRRAARGSRRTKPA